uniref:Uncharacterized protein n=1 Tax=Candidatus Kentrum sp. FW TaxID=2126338 RepID=A0A450TK17_9GAMM|nr:MAG: hypothetical protein BECKFW1821C_GA0114237_10139 [Candidatus Kentron sp. FW]
MGDSQLTGEKVVRFRITVNDTLALNGDAERFTREIVFWGRRTAGTTYRDVREQHLSAS